MSLLEGQEGSGGSLGGPGGVGRSREALPVDWEGLEGLSKGMQVFGRDGSGQEALLEGQEA